MNETQNTRAGFFLLCFLLLSSWFLSFGKPLLSSHCDRQIQTAVAAKVYVQEGWNLFLPKMRFSGKPGYCALECPIYQSLVAGLSSVLKISVDTSGRLISLLSALGLILGVLCVCRLINDLLRGDSDLFHGTGLWFLVLGFSSPELFGVSQWVIIELFNAALAVWCLFVFLKMMTHKELHPGWFLGFGALMIVSILTKPTALFGIAPLFAYTLWLSYKSAPQSSTLFTTKFIGVAVISGISLAALLIWSHYADRLDIQYHAVYRLLGSSSSRLMFNPVALNIPGFSKILGRAIVYLIGPGTLLYMAVSYVWYRTEIVARLKTYKYLLATCLMSALLYLFVFAGANFYHNYYQLQIWTPIFMAVAFLMNWQKSLKTLCLLIVSCGLNVALGQTRLATNDKAWVQALPYLQTHIAAGIEKSELVVVSNSPVAARLTTYYIDRYGKIVEPEQMTDAIRKSAEDWLIVCDNALDTACYAHFRDSPCDSQATIDRLWLCNGHH